MEKKFALMILVLVSWIIMSFSWQYDKRNQLTKQDHFIDLNKNGIKDIYEDSEQTVQARVENLMELMTLEEKVAQTECIWIHKFELFSNNIFDVEKAKKVIPFGLGHLGRPNEGSFYKFAGGLNAQESAELANNIQKYFIENTRLGIPVIFHEESLHGQKAQDATIFPSVIGMSSSWNDDLISEVFSNIAKEVRYRGGSQVLAPVVDLALDPRWGRTDETLGEDPYLTSRLGVAIVKAYQGNSKRIDGDHVAATIKHMGVHGQPESGTNAAPVFVSERHLRQTFLKPFEACVKEGGVLSIMAAYPENSGVPSHADRWLFNDLLRNEWGFEGMVVSDYGGIQELETRHHIAENAREAAQLAITAGVDMELPDPYAYPTLLELVKSGKLNLKTLNKAVARILELKFRLGLFDEPYVDSAKAKDFVGNSQMRNLALKAARQSMILLKNQENLLPLDPKTDKKIAIIGPNADECLLGGYAGTPKQTITPLKAIKEKYPEVDVTYAKGCELVHLQEKKYRSPVPSLVAKEENITLINEAVKVAKDADIILLFLGANEFISRESMGAKHGLGDLANLELFGEQNELIDSLSELNKPIVAFVFSGPPISFLNLSQKAQSIIQCWYLGQETGYAIAETLFGDSNPSGKLTISVPRSAGHIPSYYYYKPSARRGYNFDDISPLYPFGYGLSYTSYEYGKLRISQQQMNINESVEASIDISNIGTVDGEEIVQLYIHDKVSSLTRPIKELKDFKRVSIKAGETQNVKFEIDADKLKFFNIDMKEVVEPGEFEIMVGPNSQDTEVINLVVTE